MDLSDKGALVTGAASGIGRATAELLAERGCRVSVVDRDEDGGKAVADAVGGLFVACDVASSAAVNAAFARCAQELGRLDIAHLNAGVATDVTDITQLSDDEYRRMMGVNVDGVVFGARAAARIMREQNGGAIVATASLAGIMAFAPDPLYTLTKHAVVGLVRSAAEGLATHGITINAVCPGFTAASPRPCCSRSRAARPASAGSVSRGSNRSPTNFAACRVRVSTVTRRHPRRMRTPRGAPSVPRPATLRRASRRRFLDRRPYRWPSVVEESVSWCA